MAAGGGSLRLWDGLTGTKLLEASAPASRMFRFSPDAAHIAIASDGGPVHIVDAASRVRLIRPPDFADGGKWSAQFSPDASVIFRDLDSIIWDAANGSVVASVPWINGRDFVVAADRSFITVDDGRPRRQLSRSEWLYHVPDLPYRRVC